jgi:DNA-binding transcriptional regulator YhcF (GntR family)
MDRRLAEYLLPRIASGEYPVGMKIPSMRRLAAKFDMPYSTVHLQMSMLVEAGILKTRAGKGVFVAQADIFPRKKSRRKIAAFIGKGVIGQQTSISYLALLEFQQQAIAAGFEVRVRPIHYTELTGERFERDTLDCCGAALFKEYDAKMFSFASRLPTVATLMSHTYGGRISLVNADDDQVAELAAAYFSDRNIKQVLVISSMSPVYRRRAAAFQDLWRQAGLDCEIRYMPQMREELDPVIGYFFTSDTQLRRYYLEYAERCGRRLDEDFVVLGVDGKRRLNPDWPLFSTVAVDWREIGACMFHELKRRIDVPGATGRRICLGGRLLMAADEVETPVPERFAAARTDRYDGEDVFDIHLLAQRT